MDPFDEALKALKSPAITRRNYTVTSISVGTSADGHDEVTVDIDGSTLVVPYIADGYSTRTAGDIVAVLTIDSSPLILGRAVGFQSL